MNVSFDDFARKTCFIYCASNMLKVREGIHITPSQMADVIGDKMDEEWKDVLYSSDASDMDTFPRYMVMDIVSNHYLGRDWPTNGGGDNIVNFSIELQRAITLS